MKIIVELGASGRALSQESGSSEGDGQVNVSHVSAFVSSPSGFVTATKAARSASQKESNVMPLRQPSAILR
jgi:hypothetical protein